MLGGGAGSIQTLPSRCDAAASVPNMQTHIELGTRKPILARLHSNQQGTRMPKTTQTTVTLKQFASQLAEEHEVSKTTTNALLSDFVGLIRRHLKKGDKVRIPGLGILTVRKRPARMGRNPATGEAIKIKASKKVAFRAAKELKESV